LQEDPKSYSFHSNQYDNLANRLAHYETTALRSETNRWQITHLVCTAGTGGTVTGTAMFLKKKILTYKFGQLMCMVHCLAKFFRTGMDMNEVHPYISKAL
jgi:cystathionine beta-synthase